MSCSIDEISQKVECPFCVENDFYIYKLFFEKFNSKNLTIQSTQNFIVLPDIAPLVEGHLLIITLDHYSCFGRLPYKYWAELQDLKSYITRLLTKKYTKPIFFEHGPALPHRAGCCIDHAHIHCLPVDTELSSTIYKNILRKRISSILELCNYTEKNISYLFYEANSDKQYIYPLPQELSILPSQYVRRVVAANLKLDKWDWKEMITYENYSDINKAKILRTIKELRINTL